MSPSLSSSVFRLVHSMRCHLLVVLLALVLPISAPAQTGFPPFGSFQSTSLDAVNQQNLNAIFVIPIFSIPGRGQGFQYNLVNNSLVWTQTGGTSNAWTPVTDASGSPTWGWTYGPAVAGEGQTLFQVSSRVCRYIDPDTGLQAFAPYTMYWNFRYKDWLGTVHSFGGFAYTVASQNAQTYCGIENSSFPVSGYSADNTGFLITVTGPGANSVLSPAGVNAGAAPVDTNGNYVSQSVHSNETDWTDTAGHLALKVFKNSTNIQHEWQDSSGNYTSATTTTVQLSAFNIKTNFACSGITEYTGTATLPTEIDLPNSTKYLITYEPTPGAPGYYTGRVQRVTFPTGGYYEYDYPTTAGDGIVCADSSVNSLTRVTNDGVNTATWTFSRTPSGSNWVTTVTAPKMSYDSAANTSVYTFNSSGQQVTAQIYQGASSLQRTVSTTWSGGAPATQTTILEDGRTENEVETSYDTYGNLLSLKEHDWGSGSPGPILRTTTLTYLNSSAYISANILNRPVTMTVADGSGTIRYRRDTAYDESGYVNTSCPSGAPQHNDANYGCSYTTRGNPTTSTTYLAPATPANPVSQHFSYDSLGNVIAVKDASNNTTTLSYADAWQSSACTFSGTTYAYVTSITNALSQATNAKYYPCSGLPYSSTDPNNQMTTLTYDVLNRPTQENFPDGGQTSWTYNSATSATTTVKMNSTPQYITSTLLLDGLGRSLHGQLNSDPEGVDYTDVTYDPLGRVASVSNPYRSTSDPTYGITSYQYDTLGRPTKIGLQDGSVTAASYSANSTTVTDPAGKKRQTTADGLGRLSQVTEDPGGLGYLTTYTYDALSNLTGVTQNSSRQRTYVYDAMSRLTSETTPEAGTITYGYDANGNIGDLTSRVAPAPNQTGSSTITTTYSYDALHRLTQKSYSDGTTTSAFFAYDGTGWWGITQTNVVGRLMEAWNGTSCCSVGGAQIFSYDPMGRVTLDNQCDPAQCPSGGLPVSYTYDFAGNLLTSTNGVGVTLSQAFDTAARATQLTSSLVDSQHPATLATTDSGVGYYPHGVVRKMNFGNGLTQAVSIEPRLQPCRINLNSSDSSITDGCDDGQVNGTIQDFDYAYGTWGSTNNGNITIMDGGPTQSFGRSYSYDSLNRLSALSSPSDPNGCTGLSWTYDAWGNRTDQTVTGGSCPTFHQTVNTQNHLANSPYAYDSAGNLTADGSHTYFYDAENRLIQVDGTLGTCSTATACYLYDAFGRRTEKITGSTDLDYLYDLSGNVVTEWCTNCGGYTGPTTEYISLAGSFVAEYKNDTTYFVHPDHLGSTRLLTDLNQNVVQNVDYLPFGELNSGNSGYTTHMFTGDERDAETSLDHTWFRQYSNAQARWLTPDPADLAAVDPSNPQSWNRYAYVENDPVDWLDPSGLGPQGPPTYECSTSDPFNMGCNPPQFGGGGSGACSLDGIATPCGVVQGVIQAGAGGLCLDATCSVIANLEPTLGGANIVLNLGPGFAVPAYKCPWGDCGTSPSWVELNSLFLGWMAFPPTGSQSSAGGNGGGGGGADDSAKALAREFKKNGAYALTNPCTVALWYGASAAGAVGVGSTETGGALFPEIKEAVDVFKIWYSLLDPPQQALVRHAAFVATVLGQKTAQGCGSLQ